MNEPNLNPSPKSDEFIPPSLVGVWGQRDAANWHTADEGVKEKRKATTA